MNPTLPPLPPAQAGDAALAAALDDLRLDVGAHRPLPDLADRVLSALGRGDREVARFHRLARRYAAVAAVLLVAGSVGSLALARPSASAHEAVAELESVRLRLEQAVSVADLAVGGR